MHPVDVPAHILQLCFVTVASWTSSSGEMEVLERPKGGDFKRLDKFPVNIGKAGLGWGPGAKPSSTPTKAEGDNRAPAGLFPILSAFGKAEFSSQCSLPYRTTLPTHEWVDDPQHPLYNQFVDTIQTPCSWKSSEKLLRPDNLYDLVFVVGYNTTAIIPNAGSAIFIHRQRGPGIGSAGCTTMEFNKLLSIAKWLRPERNPHMLQIVEGG